MVALAGCTTLRSPDPRDPWEGLNRATFEFNDGLDQALIKPVAEGYRFVMPDPARAAVTNFFSNLNDPWVALNQLMQGKVRLAIDDFGRFFWNSTIGLLGLIDVASDMGLTKHNEDFGQTLAVWGVEFGPYFVIPLLGPSSVRDAGGKVADAFAYLPWQIPKWADFDHRVAWQNSLSVLDIVQTRANLLDASNLLEEAALDRYAFLRTAYFQRRRSLIYDGDPPPLAPDKQSSAAPAEPVAATPPAGPVAATPPAEPVAATPPAGPVAATPPAEPVAATPPAEPVAATPPTEPAAAAPPAEPVPVAAPAEPVAAAPPEPVPAAVAAEPVPAGQVVDPKVPANYAAVLAAGAPRAVAAK